MHLEGTITIRLDLNRHETWILSTLDQNPRIISMAAGKRLCGVQWRADTAFAFTTPTDGGWTTATATF